MGLLNQLKSEAVERGLVEPDLELDAGAGFQSGARYAVPARQRPAP